jgi:hypothetical protein
MIAAALARAERLAPGSAMEEQSRITGTDLVRARLDELARTGGTPADFEEAVRQLAPDIERPMTFRGALLIARTGWAAFNGFDEVPSDVLAEFQGRSWDSLSAPSSRAGDGSSLDQLAEETLPAYVGRLGESVCVALGYQADDEDVPATLVRALSGYVAVLAIRDLRAMVGWERSVDAHALGMLMAERGMRHLGEVGMTLEEEEGCFRWLHLATYDDVGPEHLAEMRARREVRIAHRRAPAGAVAVMTCEIPVVGALWFQELMTAMPTENMDRESLRRLIDHLAVHAETARRWQLRKEAFAEIGRLDLTEASQPLGRDYVATMHGHLLRWMVENDAPVRPHMLGWTQAYVGSIHLYLIDLPVRKGRVTSSIAAHLYAIRSLWREMGPVPLADELALLAWLMDQKGFGIRLAPYLDTRERRLAELRP